MRVAVLFCFIILVILFQSSCDVCSCKKVPCPAFDNAEFTAWFPYNSNSTILFKNNTGVADTLSIYSVNKSSSYEARKGCYHGDKGCNTDGSIYATLKHSANANTAVDFNFRTLTAFESSTPAKNLALSFGSFNIQATDLGTNGLVNITTVNYSASFHSQLTLNNTTFSNVQQIVKDTLSSKQAGIYKLYLSRNEGIIAYEQYPSQTIWIKQ
ncbi:MAG TPA: hypothetical protein VF476_00585 [Chitinophagaceae bacterium]